MEADPGQDVERAIVGKEGALDDVEGVELDLPVAHVGQVPAGRRCGMASAAGVEGTVTLEDPADRADRGQGPGQVVPRRELTADRRRPVLAEGALLAQPAPDVEDQLFGDFVDP